MKSGNQGDPGPGGISRDESSQYTVGVLAEHCALPPAVELLLRTAAGSVVDTTMQGKTVAAPAHFDAEVFSALGRLARDGAIGDDDVDAALVDLARSPVRRLPVAPLLGEAWALRHNVSPRDALYVVLARRLAAALVTADTRLGRVRGLGVAITVVAP